MAARNIAKIIKLTEDEQEQLIRFSNSRSLPHGLAVRAKIILLASKGLENIKIAEKVDLSRQTVAKWRKRFIKYSIQGLYDEIRPGRPRSISDDKIAEAIKLTLEAKPKGKSHWSTRLLAKETGLSQSTVSRIWRAFGIKPHRQDTFTLSTDPFFVEKVRDIVGLYLNPPENSVVLCVDEKSQCQALERTQPILPMGLGYVEGITHTYVRHGTTTLFAALDISNGEVITTCKPRHRHQEFLSFLRLINKNVPENLDLHIIVDNYSTHKHSKVKGWLARHPRFHIHFTPTYSSWLNQVERWFGLITQQAIRRDSFKSVKELVKKINAFVEAYNKNSKPFVWTATADSIFEKLCRLCERISDSAH
jgi:putative transposase